MRNRTSVGPRRKLLRNRHSTPYFGLGFEKLESRRMLSTIPIYKTYNEFDNGGDWVGEPTFTQVGGAIQLNVAPMQQTYVNGTSPASDTGDVFKLALGAGQLVSIQLQPSLTVTSGMKLVLANANGQTVATGAKLTINPDTGFPFNTPALTYRAPSAGTYYVGVFNLPGPATGDQPYTMIVRPIGLSAVTPDNAGLSFADGTMYAFLSGSRLDISGPTGYGFEMTGNWTKTTTQLGGGMSKLTFTANAGINLVTPLGNLPVPLPKGTSLILTTKSNGWNGAFGEIDKVKFVTGLAWLDRIVQFNNRQFGIAAMLPDGSASLDVLQGTEVGLALGSTISASIDINARVNPAIPYLYFVSSNGVSASFGNISVSAAQTRLSLIVDPADPSLYVGVNIPVGPVPGFSVAGSLKGLVPFKPDLTPSQYDATQVLRGHLFFQGEVNIPTPVPGLAVNVGGAVLLNLDVNHDGQLLAYLIANPTNSVSNLVALGTLQPILAPNSPQAADLAFGVNGKAGISLTAYGALTATFNLTKATIISTGTASPQLYFRGQITDNLLTGTFLEKYASFVKPNQTIIFDGYSTAGTFIGSYEANYSFYGFNSGSKVTVNGTNLNVPGSEQLSATLTNSLDFLGNSIAMLTGQVDTAGTFQLDGTANATLAGFTFAAANLHVDKNGITLSGNLNLGVIGTVTLTSAVTTNGQFTLTGSLMTDFGTGAPKVNADLTLTNTGMSGSTTVSTLGKTVTVTGSIQSNLDYSFTGTTSVTFPFTFLGNDYSPTTTASVALSRINGTISIGATFSLHFVFDLVVSQDLILFQIDANFGTVTFDVGGTAYLSYDNNGGRSYSGTLTFNEMNNISGVPNLMQSVVIANGGITIDIGDPTGIVPVFTIPLPF